MRISDWSSDVCSSDLQGAALGLAGGSVVADAGELQAQCVMTKAVLRVQRDRLSKGLDRGFFIPEPPFHHGQASERFRIIGAQVHRLPELDRKSVGSGKGGSVRVDLGGARVFK